MPIPILIRKNEMHMSLRGMKCICHCEERSDVAILYIGIDCLTAFAMTGAVGLDLDVGA